MDVLVRVVVLDLEGQPKDINLQLEAYDLRANAWRGVEDILKAFSTAPKISRSGGRHEISFTLKEAAFLELFGATAFFRLVSLAGGPEGDAAPVILAGTSVSGDADKLEVDFGTVLFLGKEHGFYTAHNKVGVFCSGLSLASDDAKFAAAQRRFYASPYEAAEAVADRARMRDQIGRLEAANAALERSLAQCQAERASLTQENSGLKEQFAALSRDLASCAEQRDRLTKQLTTCASERQAAITQIQTLQRQLTATAAELRRELEARQKAEADLASCGDRVLSLEQQLKESLAALDACGRARAEIEKRAAAAERERDALEDRVGTLTEERRLVAAELEVLRRQTSDQAGFVEGLRTELFTEKATAFAATEKLALFRAQLRSEVPAEAVFKNLAKGLGDATRQLATDNIPYRIGRTRFTLKTFVGADGGKMFLPDAAHTGDNPALSEVSVELIPDEAIAPSEGAMTVPDVLGLTETAAIRVLASLSLRAEKAVETVTNQPEKHGRALRQIPKAGVLAAKGETILVIYGVEKGNQSGQ
jgi:predicted  nucleic acid-binding Zn-ribbon protein